MISPKKVQFNKFMSTDFPTFTLLTDVAFDSDNGETSAYLSREAVASESYHGELKRVYGYKYTETLSPKLTFVKEGFTDFTFDETRQVLTWLTSKKTASFLDVYDDINAVDVVYSILGGFTDIQLYKLANNRTVGIVAIFESVAPYAFSDLYRVTKDITNPADNNIQITVSSDEPHSAIYPRITIQHDSMNSVVNINKVPDALWSWKSNTVYYNTENKQYYWIDSSGVTHASATNTSGIETTSIEIHNLHTAINGDTRKFTTTAINNIKGETVVLDGANRVVSSSRIGDRVFGDDFDWQWIPMYNGTNNLSFIGNGEVTIEWREPRKCGEF